jgi:hypothetical protein
MNVQQYFRIPKGIINQDLVFEEVGSAINLSGTLYTSWNYVNGKLYGTPYNSSQFGIFDPVTASYSVVGATISGTDKSIGSCLAANGFLYMSPFSRTRVIKFNPVDDTWSEIGSTYSGTFKWGKPVLAPNGCLYAPPWGNAGRVLKIDPSTDTTSLIGPDYGNTNITGKWTIGTLATTGNIYFAPTNRRRFLKVETSTDTVSEVGTDYGVNGRFNGCCLQDNGEIITAVAGQLVIGSNRYILKINPATDASSLVLFTTVNIGSFGNSIISLPNSDVFQPSPFNFYYRKNLSDVFSQKNELLFNNVVFDRAVLATSENAIHLIHEVNARKIIKVTNFGSYPADSFTFPTLANLATSNWNKYQNKY